MKALYIFLFALVSSTAAFSQDANTSAVKDMLESKTFIFKVQTVIPAAGASRQVNNEYDVRITPEKIVSYLPYFGRAFTAPIDPSNAGYNFTSKEYDYKLKERRKGGWELAVKIKDVTDVRTFNFIIFENGNATLQVTSNSKQTISYSGTIANAN